MRVFWNDRFVDEADVRISFDDRGFLFADGVYEVIRLYHGRPYRLAAHLDRLERSQRGILLEPVERRRLEDAVADLAAREGREAPDSIIYIEITRGASPRAHSFPDPPVPPTVVAWCRAVVPPAPERVRDGIAVVTVPDDRWAQCWIKTVNLVANVVAKERARRAGAEDARFVRDGMVLEGTASNLFIVEGGVLRTAPVTNYILPGVTRAALLDLAASAGLDVRLEPFRIEELMAADEVFLSGTTTEVLPIAVVDGRRISDGLGPAARRLGDALRADAGLPPREVAARA